MIKSDQNTKLRDKTSMANSSSNASATDKSQTTIGSSFTVSEEERDEKFMGDKFQNFGWKAVLLLQFQPQFEMMIMIAIYVSYVCSVLDFAYAFSTKAENIPNTYRPIGINVIFYFDALYAVDILLMIMYKNTQWIEMQHLYNERHAVLVVLDIISTIPLDAVYYSLTEAYMKLIYGLRVRYTLRIFRLLKKLKQIKNAVGVNHLLIELLDFFVCFTLLLVTVSSIKYLLECEAECNYEETDTMKEAFYVMAGKITSRGLPIGYPKNTSMFFLYALTNFFSFVYISGFVVGLFLVALIQQYRTKFLSEDARDLILKKIRMTNIKDKLIWSTSHLFFRLFWKHRKSMRFDNFNVKVVPEVMAKEISLDISWDALKHSHLFRDSEVHFLRFLAPYMTQTFMIPGESIYRRKVFKSAMVYLVSGVIQILSEEDGETPILSFSGGTCIGESTLLIDYPSTCSVVCQSYCEIYVLHRKDFMKVMLKYPEECKIMLRNIQNRYKDAQDYQHLLDFAYKGSKRKREILILKWLKTTLHELMTKDNATAKRHLTTEETRTAREFDQLVFCCSYLDMLVITEQIELVTDTVFLRTSCPCILQPDSFVVATWNNAIFIAVLAFALVYPYYASFFPLITKNYLIFSYIISLLWMLDVYVTISTGIRTKEGIVAEVKKIIMYKFESFDFIADVLAAFPVELFALLLTGSLGMQTFVLLQSPRLLKMYIIGRFFDEGLTAFTVIIRTYLKYVLYALLLLYYVGALLYLQLCYNFVCDQKIIFFSFIDRISKGKTSIIITVCMYFAAQQLTSVGLKINASGTQESLYIEIIIIEFLMSLFYVNLLSNIAATEALKRIGKLKITELATNVLMTMENMNVNPQLCREVFLYIHNQLQYNKGTDILYPPATLFYHFNPYLIKEVRKTVFVAKMKRIPLFMDWPQDLLVNLATVFFINILMPGETLTCSGEVCKEMHIIFEGFCEMYSSSDQTPKIIGPGYSVSLIEMCCEIPVVNNVVTLTHCKLCTIKHDEFMRELRRYPEFLSELKDIYTSVAESENAEVLIRKETYDDERQISKVAFSETSSFKNFGYNLDPKTKESVAYHGPFDELSVFGFLRYLLMRHTIRPCGKFIRYWEAFRCIFAFLTALLTPISPLTTCRGCGWNYILVFLDATAWIDIYLRHHICYFNEKGIEITHPLKTAIYYWKHGLVVDLLAVLPFERILKPVVNSTVRNRSRIMLQSIRILQIHRIIRGIQFLDKDLISPPRLWTITKYIPIFFITLHSIAMLTMNMRCVFDPDIEASADFTSGVSCKDSWISKSRLSKPLSPTRVYFCALFGVTAIATGPSMGGFIIDGEFEALNFIVITLIGYFLFMCINAKVISANLFRNTDLRSYQEAMRDLVRFLSYRHIDPKLKREVIEHFEHVWRRKKGKDVQKLIEVFNSALQENILLDLYGKVMKESAVFAEASNSFFRSVLLHARHEHIMKRGIITRVNSVHNRMYFLLKGKVEVLGPDYNRLLVLPVGSLFGNIDDCIWSRQSLTMVAKCHVEFLAIKTTAFYKILSKYSHLNQHFRQLLSVNTDYLLGAPQPSLYGDSLTLATRATSSAPVKSAATLNIVFTNFRYVYATVLWQNIILVLVCYVGFITEVFQMTVQDHGPGTIAFLYMLDVLLVIDIYLKFRTAYEDESGVLITDRKQIALRYIKDPRGFRLHLASVVPLEILALIFLQSRIVWRIWSYLRCNRFIRILLVVDYFRRKNRQLNINVSLMRTFGLLFWVSLLLQILTCVLITAICLEPEYHARPVLNCKWDEMSRSEKFHVYKTKFAFVLSLFTSSSEGNFFPNSEFLCLLMVVFLITSRFVFTYFVAEIAATLDIVLHNRMKYEEDIDVIKEHMVRERLSPVLLDRIWLYLRVLWKRKKGLQFPSLLLEAPTYLRQGVLNAMFGFHLRRHKIFGRCHTDIIRQIAGKLRTRTFFPDDYITFVNDSDECMYFIHEGAVDVLSEDDLYSERIDKVLYKDDMFGFEQGVYPRFGHEYTYRANRHSLILMLKREDWIHLLDFFPASKKLIFSKMRRM